MLKVLLLLLSFLGYYMLLFCAFEGKKAALYPAIITSSIIVLGFLGGIFGVLKWFFLVLFYAGFVLIPLCIYYYVRERQNFPEVSILETVFPLAVLGVGMFWLYLMLDGYFLYHPDDFSHWGKITRVIAMDMRFPLESDLLTHASYPPGSALFIGYVSSVIGNTEANWLFGQAVLILSFWIAILSACKKVWMQVIFAALIIPLMSYNTPLRALLVDNLLAAAILAGLVICLELGKGRFYLGYLALAMPLSAICLCKNSGLFFAVLIALYAVYLRWVDRRKLTFRLLFLLIPFVLYTLWNRYIDLYFTNDLIHQMSLDHYQSIFGSKTPEDIQTILNIILPIMFDPLRNHAILVLAAYLVLLFVYKQQKTLPQNANMLVFALISFVVYEVGMLLMYLFSMPMDEIIAQNGQDYDRYNGTITAVLLAFLLYQVSFFEFFDFEQNPKFKRICAIAAGVGLTVFSCYLQFAGTSPLRPMDYQISKYQTAYQFSLLGEDLAEIPSDSLCIVYFNEEGLATYYARSLSRYYLRTTNISRHFEEASAAEEYANTPWAYYINLSAGTVYPPTETVNTMLYTQTNTRAYTNVLDRVGYKENARFSVSSNKDIFMAHMDITGSLTVQAGDVIRLKNVVLYPSSENEGRTGVYCFSTGKQYKWHSEFKTPEDVTNWAPMYDAQGNIIQITVPASVGSAVNLRILCQDINQSSVITINEEIK